VRIAVVSPYSWTYPGGVTRHIESLAGEFVRGGHEVRVLAPSDPDDRRASLTHRGARPAEREHPEWLIDLGRTYAFSANGAQSNLAVTLAPLRRLHRALREGDFDVVHIHEPLAPMIGWDALLAARVPLVGTFHAYSENRVSNNIGNIFGARLWLNHLHVRIAVSHAAEWTGRRFFGGRYRVIPNGVVLPPGGVSVADRSDEAALKILFVGQAVERKGLPLLLRAFEALREHIPAELTLVGVDDEEVKHLLLDDGRGVRALGKVDEATKDAELAAADVLCAPSLGGESFGMVLTEAFAAGTTVVASDIAGYRDVVSNGCDGVLVRPGDATELAEVLRDLYYEPERRLALARAAASSVERYAWPRIADEVLEAYEDARAIGRPSGRLARAAARVGVLPADLEPLIPARRLPTLEPAPALTAPVRRPGLALARRIAVPIAAVLAIGLAALALQRIGVANVGRTLAGSSPGLVCAALALMCASMFLRAASWHAILRAALPAAHVRRRDALQGTSIGVLMSATLPARLGEPSRAFVVARRLGRLRERFPVVLGTIVSQTLLNLLALAVLGGVMFSTASVFAGHETALLAVAALPVVALAVVLLGPSLLRGRRGAGKRAGFIVRARRSLKQVRSGLRVFRDPRLGPIAAVAQLGAWALQWLSCLVLLHALGIGAHVAPAAAAAVLFAVNVTAVVPVTPSNLGIFQAACVAVLAGGYGVSSASALGYGIVLQAVEVTTAVIMGGPALLKEGLSWREVRLRAMHTAPVKLSPGPAERRRARDRAGRAGA
jgi:phosphatidylinositol alpha-mannosyltransferase